MLVQIREQLLSLVDKIKSSLTETNATILPNCIQRILSNITSKTVGTRIAENVERYRDTVYVAGSVGSNDASSHC